MADKLFAEHETDKAKAEQKTQDYSRSLGEIGGKVQTHKSGTEAMENAHHGRKAASENRRK